MTAKNSCKSCGWTLPDDAPGGLCPACVLRAAARSAAPIGGPPLDEIRRAFPQWEILECIGRGGMGIVYKVWQPQLDRHAALKLLDPGLHANPDFAERFAREARILGKLAHPNIVAIHDFGETEGLFWLMMEFVDGVNLRQAMQAGRFSPAQALAIIPDICTALQFAHDHGVLHRDIKPENVLLDSRGRVKIADFGIARLLGGEHDFTLTRTGFALGSAAYIAPEQIESPHDVDHRADIFSLGVVFYEMLTGELPLGRFPAPSEKSASDPRLDEVVFRALAKEREKRFQQAGEFRENITHAADRPAAKPAAGYLANRFVRIPLSAVIAAVLTVVSLLVGVPTLRILWKLWDSIRMGDDLDLAATIVIRFPGIAASLITALAGCVVGAISLIRIRNSNGTLRGIRIAGFATFAWLVTWCYFAILLNYPPSFTPRASPGDLMNEMFQASACLALSAVAGWMTKWVLAGWLGIPRNCDLMRGEIPWFVIKLVAALLAAYILLTNLIYYFL